MSGVETKHPDYTPQVLGDWSLCRDAYRGESAVKASGETYLPKPSGFSRAGGHADDGRAAYAAYKARAEFPDFMERTVGAMIGIIHDREIQIEIPSSLEYLHENVDGDGQTLVEFHKKITRGLLIEGRFGVLADAPENGGDPYLAGYLGPAIINWDRGFFVLDESGMVRDGFAWTHEERYRVLSVEDGAYRQSTWVNKLEAETTPTALGGGALRSIPFAVGSAVAYGPEIGTPPLAGVARASRVIYQLTADERHQLYMSGQETLVAINGEAPKAVGAGVVHEMNGRDGETPDLKYVSPSCAGIDAHARKIASKVDEAIHAGARLLATTEAPQESGTARSLRFKSETASILTVAQMSCAILEHALRGAAMLKGMDERTARDQIIVIPPSDLLDRTMTPAELAQLFGVYVGGGISWDEYFALRQAGGLASADMTAEAEYALIEGQGVANGMAP